MKKSLILATLLVFSNVSAYAAPMQTGAGNASMSSAVNGNAGTSTSVNSSTPTTSGSAVVGSPSTEPSTSNTNMNASQNTSVEGATSSTDINAGVSSQ